MCTHRSGLRRRCLTSLQLLDPQLRVCVQGQVRAFGENRLGVSPLVASREVDSLAPLHGPVVHSSMAELLRMYRCAACARLLQRCHA